MKLAPLALLLCISTPALADQIYPGSSCQPRLGNEAQYLNTYTNEVTNIRTTGTTTNVNVICPIVRNNVDSTAPITVYARIRNGNATASSSCQILASDWRGQNVRGGNRATVSGSNNFSGVDLAGPTSHAGGTLQLLCDLSSGSQLVNYLVFE